MRHHAPLPRDDAADFDGSGLPVSAVTALRMRMHYKVCVWCERYRDQVALISELSKECPESDHGAPGLSGEARERIGDAVKKEIT